LVFEVHNFTAHAPRLGKARAADDAEKNGESGGVYFIRRVKRLRQVKENYDAAQS
jgi:hypothetical protein